MNHVMREDVRRRFVAGFTIENSSMRYWFCSRSDVFVSEPFNTLKDHSELVDFIFRISFASEQELGWDTSIPLYEPSLRIGKPQYNIAVRDGEKGTTKPFRTRRLISNIGADPLSGRGTRVWEAIELGGEDGEEMSGTGSTCVLKDFWVDNDRMREGAILAQIPVDANARGPESDEKRTMDNCVLNVLTYGDVHVDGDPDKTRNWDFPTVNKLIEDKVDPKSSTQVYASHSVVGGMTLEAETGADKGAKMDTTIPKIILYYKKTHH
ncbi:hypothetical protein PHLGIDRAFT_321572 [Phlebiopsis gigantea 11061_1 CR5-6]|uniref:Fungal-type protein kinase domain-containing protein n=1 Tax=Phlebiopsis gigantea (strain 11061_1 CR5-6) TaxID=745531 RepID=A0A0C3S2L9_PHLG1|nr:hypothetical protein PHLGIDRAFT_321572 [Phlebiopsis gigantea 11061_1 CR5-6]